MGVPAKSGKQAVLKRMNCGQRIQQVEACNRPSRPMGMAIFMGEHKSRPSRPIDDPRGQNPQHPAMPCRVIEHDAFGRKLSIFSSQQSKLSLNRLQCFGLGRPPVIIQSIQLLCQLRGPLGIPSQKQLDNIARNIHASGCIDARCKPKTYLGRRGWTIRRDLCHLHQCSQSRLDWIAKCLQPQCRNYAVLAFQRHRIRNRRNRHQLQKRGNDPRRSLARSSSVLAAADKIAWASLKATPAPQSDLKG